MQLALYALFKQGTVGDIDTSRPGIFDPKGRAKWDAWEKQKGGSGVPVWVPGCGDGRQQAVGGQASTGVCTDDSGKAGHASSSGASTACDRLPAGLPLPSPGKDKETAQREYIAKV